MSKKYVKARVNNPTVTTVTIKYSSTSASASVSAPKKTTSFGNTIIAKGSLSKNVLAKKTAPKVVSPYKAYTKPKFTSANIIKSKSSYSSPSVQYSSSLAIKGPGGNSILSAKAKSQAIVSKSINANSHSSKGSSACVYSKATQQRAKSSKIASIAII